MQRWIPILGIMLAVQLALAIGLNLRTDRLAPSASDALLVSADLKNVDQLVFDGPAVAPAASPAASPAGNAPAKPDATRVELVKRDGRWVLPGLHDAPADATRVQALLDKLGTVKRGFPVARTADGLKRFKVADDDYERRLVASSGGKAVSTVYLGASAALRRADARTAADSEVYAVELTPQDVPVTPTEWLDAQLVKVDAAALTEIDVAPGGKTAVTLVKAAAPAASAPAPAAAGSAAASAPAPAASQSAPAAVAAAPAWEARDLPAGKLLNVVQANLLATAVANLRVDGVLGTQAKPEWQQDAPELRLTLKSAQGQPVTWIVSKPKTGDSHVLKASDKPWFVELKSWNSKPLLDAAVAERLLLNALPAADSAASAAAAAAAGTKPGASKPASGARPAAAAARGK